MRFRRSTDRYRRRKILMVLGVLSLWGASFLFLFRDILFVPATAVPQISAADKAEIARRKLQKREELIASFRAAELAEKRLQSVADAAAQADAAAAAASETVMQSEDGGAVIVSGWLTVLDPWGGVAARFRAAVAGDGWLALPVRSVLGGSRFVFTSDSGQESEVSSGVWRDGARVGLWRLASDQIVGPSLGQWGPRENVGWMSIETAKEYQEIQIESVAWHGMFSVSALSNTLAEIGIFTQNGGLVGWSFGQLLPDAYLWNLDNGATRALQENISVAGFYEETFANGREEKFAMGLAMQSGYTDYDRLAVFVSGFFLPAKIAPDDTPYHLAESEIIYQIRILLSRIYQHEKGSRLMEILNSEALVAIGDIGIFIDMVPIMAAYGGYQYAIEQIETTGRALVEKGGVDVPALNNLHLELYQGWVQALVSSKSLDQGVQALIPAIQFYPDDPYLHLLRVELELMNGNWPEAERLLYERNYPSEFLDRYEILSRRIAEMKGEEGKIVIRFSPGSNRIPVTAALNESLRQDFLVDTGASMVTIPSSVAEALGLETQMDHWGGERMVSTAGGMVAAREVIIPALEIGGWTEYDVRALVLDIPGQPGVGLLGLNYLSRFHMDLRSNEGTLLLTPR